MQEFLKALSENTRLRILSLLDLGELSVADLQQILDMGQSKISMHLGVLKKQTILTDTRQGKKIYYSLNKNLDFEKKEVLLSVIKNTKSKFVSDNKHLNLLLEAKRKLSEEYFNNMAGKIQKSYCPGRNWESVCKMLFRLVPNVVIADLGAGEGVLSHLLAKNAKKIYCIDSSKKMVKNASMVAKDNDIKNVEYILGDIQKVPMQDKSVDIALFSHSLHHAENPELAISEAHRILKKNGRILILDLQNHSFEKAKHLYADKWLGFSKQTIHSFLEKSNFSQIEVLLVSKEDVFPKFETIFATAIKK